MQEKIDSAKRIIETVEKQYLNPIIYCGFGKDSITVLHLCRSMGYDWDIMFHRDPFFPIKYRYANKIIQDWNLRCRDYPAHMCSVFYMNNTFEVVRHFRVGTADMVLVALLYEPDEYIPGQYLCGLRDLYMQPKGDAEYVWDVGIQGHRVTDAKPHSNMESPGLRWQIKHNLTSADFAFPIWDWTGQDLYRYLMDNGVPINYDVYDVVNDELVPKKDPTFNPDRRPACTQCMRPSNSKAVFCPKQGVMTNNVYEELMKCSMPNDFEAYELHGKEIIKDGGNILRSTSP